MNGNSTSNRDRTIAELIVPFQNCFKQHVSGLNSKRPKNVIALPVFALILEQTKRTNRQCRPISLIIIIIIIIIIIT